MVQTLNSWSHARLTFTADQILKEATTVNCACHWKHSSEGLTLTSFMVRGVNKAVSYGQQYGMRC